MVYPLINLGKFPIYNIMAGIGLIAAILVFNKNISKYNIPVQRKDNLELIFIFCAFIGVFFANFINWFVMPGVLKYPVIERFPARELESLFLFMLFYLFQYKIKNNRCLIYFYSYAIFRFFIEFGRGDNRGKIITSLLSPAQLISIIIIFCTTLYLLYNKLQFRYKVKK